ncbi:hypothetical protein ACFYNO_07250 [Kitasatospora sp. NPDC006697]|uniref:hypothetical protein n=1 Tax=Kitasatospora sp. NPDC006697 TaxID=3364020 RepID=UPI00368CC3BF
MLSNRLLTSAVLCAALAVGATACGSKGSSSSSSAGSSKAATAPSSAPASASAAASAPASASASAADADISGLTGEQILAKAHAAMASLTSMRVAGNVTTGGQKIVLDLVGDKDKNCTGTVTVGATGTVQVIHNAQGTWMKPDTAFWENISAEKGKASAGPAIAQFFKDKYLTGGQDDASMQEVAGMCDIVSGIADDQSKETDVVKGATSTVDGQSVIGISAKDDSGEPTQLSIATKGQPYLIRMSSTGSEPGQMDFSEFNKPVTVQAPPADQVVDYTQFEKKVQSV